MKFDPNWTKFKPELPFIDRTHSHTLALSYTLTHLHTLTHSRENADVHTHNFTQKKPKIGFLSLSNNFNQNFNIWVLFGMDMLN